MRIDIHAINFTVSDKLSDYARGRVWQAVGPLAKRVSWVGLWLVDHQVTTEGADISCRLDAWVRRHGVVTVRLSESEPYRAIDTAAARLERALARKVGRQALASASAR